MRWFTYQIAAIAGKREEIDLLTFFNSTVLSQIGKRRRSHLERTEKIDRLRRKKNCIARGREGTKLNQKSESNNRSKVDSWWWWWSYGRRMKEIWKTMVQGIKFGLEYEDDSKFARQNGKSCFPRWKRVVPESLLLHPFSTSSFRS